MGHSSLKGAFGFMKQSAKGTKGVVADTFWHKIRSGTIGPASMQDVLPPEIGGTMYASGAYRGGYAVGGTLGVYPRLEDYFPLLLAAVAGAATITGTGPYTHTFKPATDEGSLPWLTFRRLVPATADKQEAIVDCRVVRMSLIFAPAAPMAVEFDVVGISYEDEDVETYTLRWSSTDPYPDIPASVPVGCSGEFTFNSGATALDPLGVRVDIVNIPAGDPEERPLFQHTREDVSILDRDVTVSFTYNWEDSTLYEALEQNEGSAWSPVVWEDDAAVEVQAKSAGNIPTEAVPWQLDFKAAKLMWAMSPVQLAGNNIIVMQMAGQVLSNDGGAVLSGDDWLIEVVNEFSTAYLA